MPPAFALNFETIPGLFHPLVIRDLTFANRVIVSPMWQYSSQGRYGNDWHIVYLGSRGTGGPDFDRRLAAGLCRQAACAPLEGCKFSVPPHHARSWRVCIRGWRNGSRKTFADFTHAQLLAVPAILDRESILLTSPTGSGKTLAGFLGIFDALLRKLDAGTLGSSVQCIYVSPLRALAYDIGKNVRAPIVGMGLEKDGAHPFAHRRHAERGAGEIPATPGAYSCYYAGKPGGDAGAGKLRRAFQ